MRGASLLKSHASLNQMLSANQLTEHHNDHLALKILFIFLSCIRHSFGVLNPLQKPH